tara:strand:- start:17 stop:124 length:108 start_codon:yes stop_codon:yes gene_type:complete
VAVAFWLEFSDNNKTVHEGVSTKVFGFFYDTGVVI